MSDTETTLIAVLVGGLVSLFLLYLVIRVAVLSALRIHAKSLVGPPEDLTSGSRHRRSPEDRQG